MTTRSEYFRAYRKEKGATIARQRKARKAAAKPPRLILGIDGEGYSLANGEHRYSYMAANSADGSYVSELASPRGRGLTHEEVFEWLLELPSHAILVGFALGYDRSKWFETLPEPVIYALVHPETRHGLYGPKSVTWGGWDLNLFGSLFSVARTETMIAADGTRRQKRAKGSTRRVWDLFKFFQCSFVKALGRWQIGSEADREAIALMKEKRGDFRGIGPDERAYCQRECALLAQLAACLFDAHRDEDLELSQFHGPGSAAALVFKKLGDRVDRVELPEEVAYAVDSAYFGGRFEVSRLGPVEGPVYAYDIKSAYPYALAMLPCMQHGEWVHETAPRALGRLVERCGAGGVVGVFRYRLTRHSGAGKRHAAEAWGPLPVRDGEDGNIRFPTYGSSGWAWGVELRAAKALHPGVQPLEGWWWRRTCRCQPPMRELVTYLFKRRGVLGEQARGLVLKLCLNSMYGKSAQRQGYTEEDPAPFFCAVRAGMVTATTRAMLLDAIRSNTSRVNGDGWGILEVATDSIFATHPLRMPSSPLGKLGSWEDKHWKGGVFLLGPGKRFAIDVRQGMGTTSSRGIAAKVMHENRARVMRAWEVEPMAPFTFELPGMFHGARGEVRKVLGDAGPGGDREWAYERGELYGKWTRGDARVFRYAATPKRDVVLDGFRLLPWEMPGVMSAPYSMSPASPMGEVQAELRDLESEQPDAGMIEPFGEVP